MIVLAYDGSLHETAAITMRYARKVLEMVWKHFNKVPSTEPQKYVQSH
jgi:hypothetical protein